MAPLTADEVTSRVMDALACTQYACSTLAPLSGGSANFLYKAKLQKPLEDGTTDVVVKHGEGFSASYSGLQLSKRRCVSPAHESRQPLPVTSSTYGGQAGR